MINRKLYFKKYYQKNKKKINILRKNWVKNHRWYSHYASAEQRCNNPKKEGYKNYGCRGIKMLMIAEDIKFLWFRDNAYNMKKPSIDRKDNDGNYTLENCRFIELGENIRKNMAKLTKKQVKEIRKIYAKNKITQKKLGIKFKIEQQTVSDIINYKKWKYI